MEQKAYKENPPDRRTKWSAVMETVLADKKCEWYVVAERCYSQCYCIKNRLGHKYPDAEFKVRRKGDLKTAKVYARRRAAE